MWYLFGSVLFSFAGYYIFAECRIYKVMKQRHYWHQKYLRLAEETKQEILPEDYCSSILAP